MRGRPRTLPSDFDTPNVHYRITYLLYICSNLPYPIMIAPFPLYVDEISPDKIKATVSNGGTIVYNLRTIALDTPFPVGFSNNNGISIIPIGKFICMLVKDSGNIGMILLDLTGKQALAEKMANRLTPVDLRDEFMNAYTKIISHPENHNRFRWVVGDAANRTY